MKFPAAEHATYASGGPPASQVGSRSSAARGNPPAASARSPADAHTATSENPSRGARVSKRELVDMTSQLAIMTRAGTDVTTALQSLARQCRRPVLKSILQEIQAEVMGGKAVSVALERYVHVFGRTYIASVAAGEASGRLAEVLEQLAELERSDLRLRSTVRTMLAYPVLLASVSSLVVLALILFVLPQFAEIFDQFETPLPAITQILLTVSVELRERFWLWAIVLLPALAGGVLFGKSPTGRQYWDYWVLNMTGVREITRSLQIGRLCRLLGMMIESGVPLLEALRLARMAARNSCYRTLFSELEQDVMNGRGLGNRLLHCSFIPPAAAEMLQTAERSGSLAMVTQLIGRHYEEEGESRLREVTTLLEPLITVVMGAVVAVVVLSVMLPMFDLATFAQKG